MGSTNSFDFTSFRNTLPDFDNSSESEHWQPSGSGTGSTFQYENLGSAGFSDNRFSMSSSDPNSEYSSYQLSSDPYIDYDRESPPSTVFGGSSNWSQAGPSSSLATSIPRRLPGRTFPEHVQEQPAPRSTLHLPCEFDRLTTCRASFRADETAAWTEHVSEHLRHMFPDECWCWFCDNHKFYAADWGGDAAHNFFMRMQHIRDHIVEGEFNLRQRRRDYPFLYHVQKHNLAPRDAVERELSTAEGPSLPRSRSPNLATPRDRQNHRNNQVPHDQAKEDRKQRREKKDRKHRR